MPKRNRHPGQVQARLASAASLTYRSIKPVKGYYSFGPSPGPKPRLQRSRLRIPAPNRFGCVGGMAWWYDGRPINTQHPHAARSGGGATTTRRDAMITSHHDGLERHFIFKIYPIRALEHTKRRIQSDILIVISASINHGGHPCHQRRVELR